MAYPALRGSPGAWVQGTAGSVTVGLPTHAEGDLLVCEQHSSSSGSTISTHTLSGWTQIGTMASTSGTRRGRVTVWAKRAAGSGETNPAPAFSSTGTSFLNRARAYVIQAGTWNDTGTLADAWEDVTTAQGSNSSTLAFSGFATTGAERLALASVAQCDDTATGITNSNSYVAQGANLDSSTGSDGFSHTASKQVATASGQDVTFTFTSGGTISTMGVLFGLVPAPTATPYTRATAADAAVQAAATRAATVDAAAQWTASRSTAVDVAVQAPQSRAADLDAYVIEAPDPTTYTVETALDAAVQSSFSRGVSVDAAVQATTTRATSVDAAARVTAARETSADAAVRAGVTRTVSVDAAVLLARTCSAALDAAAQTAPARTASVDAAVLAGQVRTASANAAVQARSACTVSLSAAVAVPGARAAELEAAVAEVRALISSADAAVAVGFQRSASLDAAAAERYARNATLDAGVSATAVLTATFDAFVEEPGSPARYLFVSIDVAVQAGATQAAEVDAAVALSMTRAADLDAAVEVRSSRTVAADAAVEVSVRLTATLSAYVYVAGGPAVPPTGGAQLDAQPTSLTARPRAAPLLTARPVSLTLTSKPRRP